MLLGLVGLLLGLLLRRFRLSLRLCAVLGRLILRLFGRGRPAKEGAS